MSTLSATAAAMPVTLLAWRPMNRGLLRGFATVLLGKSLKIADVSVFQSNGKTWASFPGKPRIGDGRALLNDKGKQRYLTITEWPDKAVSERFSAAVVAAVIAEHGPEALEPST